MNSLSIAACCCGLAVVLAAPLAQAQPNKSLPSADRNMTGHVTLAEYQKSRSAYILKADTNRDGKVSKAEWDTYAKAVRRDLELGGVKGAEVIGTGPWWTLIDANKDGVATQAEINVATKSRFAKYDANKDLLISRAEAEQVRKAAAPR